MPEKKKTVGLLELMRARLMIKKYSDTRSFTSKHAGSRNYLSIPGRRRIKKQERMNRKAGRRG